MIDGIDNLDESAYTKALDLVWCARQWPSAIRVALSCVLGGQPHREIERRKTPQLKVCNNILFD